jgi:20S proteasome subunit alpha 4
MEAVRKGAAVVGIRARDCVVIAVERKAAEKLQVRGPARRLARALQGPPLPPPFFSPPSARHLSPPPPPPIPVTAAARPSMRPPPPPLPQDDRTLHKIARLDDHITLAFAGMSADARVMINKARIECQSYRLRVEDAPTVEFISRFIGQMQQKNTQRGGVRPYGVSMLIAGVGADGPQLWSSDPSGVYSAWKAAAVGRSSKTLMEMLEKQYEEGCSGDAALKLAARALLEVVESGAKSLEIGVMRLGAPLEMVSEARLEALAAEIEREKAEAAEGGGGGGGGGGR